MCRVLLDNVSNAFLFYSIILLIVLMWCIKDSQNELPLMIVRLRWNYLYNFSICEIAAKKSLTIILHLQAIRINVVCVLFDFWILFDTSHLTCKYFTKKISFISERTAWVQKFLNFSVLGFLFFVGRLFNLFLRFVTIPLLSKMCSDKTGGINDGLPEALIPIFGMSNSNVFFASRLHA